MDTFPKGISTVWNATLFKVWTCVALSSSYDNDHYTTSTSNHSKFGYTFNQNIFSGKYKAISFLKMNIIKHSFILHI